MYWLLLLWIDGKLTIKLQEDDKVIIELSDTSPSVLFISMEDNLETLGIKPTKFVVKKLKLNKLLTEFLDFFRYLESVEDLRFYGVTITKRPYCHLLNSLTVLPNLVSLHINNKFGLNTYNTYMVSAFENITKKIEENKKRLEENKQMLETEMEITVVLNYNGTTQLRPNLRILHPETNDLIKEIEGGLNELYELLTSRKVVEFRLEYFYLRNDKRLNTGSYSRILDALQNSKSLQRIHITGGAWTDDILQKIHSEIPQSISLAMTPYEGKGISCP